MLQELVLRSHRRPWAPRECQPHRKELDTVSALLAPICNHSLTISRFTYGATLAELTSLEEMTRILMESRQVHVDVINKLWQVYSEYGAKALGLQVFSCPL